MPKDDKVLCETPTPGKQPARIDRWKYDLIRNFILKVVPSDEQGVEFRDLSKLVEQQISPSHLGKLGSVSWYTTTVKLDMEVKGEIERVPGSKPQRLRIAGTK
jgi:hypothetical protein